MPRIMTILTDDAGLSAEAKMVYLIAMMKQPASIRALADAARLDHRPIAACCRELQPAEWMRLTEDGRRLKPEAVVPHHVEESLAAEIRSLVSVSAYKGESRIGLFLEWMVAPSVRLIPHARPDFLRNKDTNQNLEYDIFAPDYDWANEYHGDQHYAPTPRYPGKDAFIERHKRDLMKIRLSKENGINLTVTNNQTLTLSAILDTIPSNVPRRAFDPQGPVVVTLEQLGREIAGVQDWDRE